MKLLGFLAIFASLPSGVLSEVSSSSDPTDHFTYPAYIARYIHLDAIERRLVSQILNHSLPCGRNDSTDLEPFEANVPPKALNFLVSLSSRNTLAVLKPANYSHLATSAGSFRLHCIRRSNWINPFSVNWIRANTRLTTLLALTVCGRLTTRHEDLLCVLVDAVNDLEAKCLLDQITEDRNSFPAIYSNVHDHDTIRNQRYWYCRLIAHYNDYLYVVGFILLLVIALGYLIYGLCCSVTKMNGSPYRRVKFARNVVVADE